MAKLHQKRTLAALLIILIIQNCSGYLKLWSSKDVSHKFNHSGHISACENLPPAFIGNTQAAKTDQCLILFSEENCKGDERELIPLFYSHLFSFTDRTVSFKPCNTNRFGVEEYSEPEAIFSYECNIMPPGVDGDPDDYELCTLPLEKVSRSCQNLHWGFRMWGIDAVNTSRCILFFDEENCEGNQSEIPVGYTTTSAPDSPLRILVKSYRTCEENQSEKHVKFYSKPNFTEIIDDVELQHGCNTKFYLNMNTVHSMETPTCVKLFQTYDCSGSFKEIIPGSDLLSSPGNLMFPFNGESVKSLMQCSDEPSMENKKILEYLERIVEQVWSAIL